MCDRVHVVAAIIERDQRLLLARRPDHLHQGGLYEFPGGKREAGEASRTALGRELAEELGIEVRAASPWMRVPYDYADKKVLLEVWRVTAFEGTAYGREGQEVLWLAMEVLAELDPATMPVANRAILSSLTMPALYGISQASRLGADIFLARLDRALDAGLRLLQLREHALDEAAFASLAQEVIARCHARGARVILNRDLDMAFALGADGVHLTAQSLKSWARPALPAGFLVAASCHDAVELAIAEDAGADFAVLSPVLPTASHPGAPTLGWDSFMALLAKVTLPVYALGGMHEELIETARQHGAQGIAMLGGLWVDESLEARIEQIVRT